MAATGWRHQNKNEHAIVMRVGNVVSFAFVSHQNRQTLLELVQGKPIVHLVTDRGLAVSKIDICVHQYCLAHLLRNIQGLAEHPATTVKETELLGESYDMLQGLFRDKHRLEAGEITEATWRQYGYRDWIRIQDVIDEILEGNPGEKVRRSCERILRDWDHFKVYLRSRDHPMTNNQAEEALRNLVIARKLCFGSRSTYGRTWRASIHSCIETLKRQGRSVLSFIEGTLNAARKGTPMPVI